MPTTSIPAPVPAHVKLGCWAITGGAAGHPVNVVYREYPSWLAAKLFDCFARWVGHECAFYLHSERDLRLLQSQLLTSDVCELPKLVLLTDAKLVERVSWVLASQRPNKALGVKAVPAMFTMQRSTGRVDLPGPTLALHGSSSQVHRASSWLDSGEAFEPFPAQLPITKVSFDPLDELFNTIGLRPASQPPLRFLDKQILKGILAGSAVLRHCRNMSATEFSAEIEDYRTIFDPIRHSATQSSDAAFEPLTLFMVQRANIYFTICAAKETDPRLPLSSIVPPSGRQISRRELADLGNARGRTVLTLVKDLYEMGELGLGYFKTLGTKKPLRATDPWPASTPEANAALLLDWSMKQVRTHFVRLHAEGFITASRSADNKPWVYQLPEALECPDSPFISLPEPDTLGLPSPALVCPERRADR